MITITFIDERDNVYVKLCYKYNRTDIHIMSSYEYNFVQQNVHFFTW